MFMNIFLHLWKDESGQDLVEYALLLVLLSLAAVASMKTIATAIESVFTKAAGDLTTT
jgi:Flp pilus assembly pilin Flp